MTTVYCYSTATNNLTLVAPLHAAHRSIIYFATDTLPRHVNVNNLEVMPERQGFGPFAFNRD